VRREEGQRSGGRLGGAAVAALLVALFLLHQDVWLWRDGRLVLGLPVGLAYHVAYCLATALVLGRAVRWAWPRLVETNEPAHRDEAGGRPGAAEGE
jgi:hypothetical protein